MVKRVGKFQGMGTCAEGKERKESDLVILLSLAIHLKNNNNKGERNSIETIWKDR